jgi:hypothetical protein
MGGDGLNDSGAQGFTSGADKSSCKIRSCPDLTICGHLRLTTLANRAYSRDVAWGNHVMQTFST